MEPGRIRGASLPGARAERYRRYGGQAVGGIFVAGIACRDSAKLGGWVLFGIHAAGEEITCGAGGRRYGRVESRSAGGRYRSRPGAAGKSGAAVGGAGRRGDLRKRSAGGVGGAAGEDAPGSEG